MSLGHGIIHAKSSKQKLNTKSSTEAEVVGVSDYVPFKILMTNFLREQGYELKARSFTKITRVRLRWKRMEGTHVLGIPDIISTSDIFYEG